jgi:hypothetical protein
MDPEALRVELSSLGVAEVDTVSVLPDAEGERALQQTSWIDETVEQSPKSDWVGTLKSSAKEGGPVSSSSLLGRVGTS